MHFGIHSMNQPSPARLQLPLLNVSSAILANSLYPQPPLFLARRASKLDSFLSRLYG